MLLIAGHERRFSVESPGAVRDGMTAREALRLVATIGGTAQLLADGLPLKAGELATVEALACRRISVATVATVERPQPASLTATTSPETAARMATTQLVLPLAG